MSQFENVDSEIKRIDGSLYKVIAVKDDQGKVVQHFNIPLQVELKTKDIMEILVGASILAVPVAFTEEVWDMGDSLPWLNTILLSIISLIFIGSFVYFSAYKNHFKLFRKEYFTRVISLFILSIGVVALLLTIVGKCPWITDFDIAMKRAIIGAFPASLSATVTDSLK